MQGRRNIDEQPVRREMTSRANPVVVRCGAIAVRVNDHMRRRGYDHSPPSEAEDKFDGVWHSTEVEFPVAYEAFWSEHVWVLVDLGVMHAGTGGSGYRQRSC